MSLQIPTIVPQSSLRVRRAPRASVRIQFVTPDAVEVITPILSVDRTKTVTQLKHVEEESSRVFNIRSWRPSVFGPLQKRPRYSLARPTRRS